MVVNFYLEFFNNLREPERPSGSPGRTGKVIRSALQLQVGRFSPRSSELSRTSAPEHDAARGPSRRGRRLEMGVAGPPPPSPPPASAHACHSLSGGRGLRLCDQGQALQAPTSREDVHGAAVRASRIYICLHSKLGRVGWEVARHTDTHADTQTHGHTDRCRGR